MRCGEAIGGGALALTGLAVAGLSLRLGIGSVAHPGAGFLPLVIGLLLGLTGLTVAVQAIRRTCEPLPAPSGAEDRRNAAPMPPGSTSTDSAPGASASGHGAIRHRNVLLAIALMIGWGLLLPHTGFVPTTAAMLAALFLIGYGPRALLPALAGGIASALLAWLVFEWLLDAGLPAGMLWSP